MAAAWHQGKIDWDKFKEILKEHFGFTFGFGSQHFAL